MAKKNEYEIAIKIAGEIGKSFQNTVKITEKELNKIARQAARESSWIDNSFAKSFTNMGKGFDNIGRNAKRAFDATAKAATVAGTALAVVSTAAIATGMSFESAFAGVKKTTDATGAEYESLKNEILEMSTLMPATANDIAAVAETAGQLGIQKDNLLDFTKIMIDLGESTNLTANDAASSLAKFANITKMSTDDYDRLGATIVDLGNKFATTEADIVEMGTRLASSGELAGLSEAQILALSTAMSSVGIEAEAGGSAMSKLLKQMQVSVETGNKSLEDFATVSGMTSKEFQAQFGQDAVSALSKFISGLNDTKRNGKSATVILDEMGLTEVRLSNTILSLANANEMMGNAVTTANRAWEENTALAIEAGKRYETTESKLKMMGNAVSKLGVAIYDDLQEPLRDGIEGITNFASATTMEIEQSNVVGNFASSIKKELPTAIRKLEDGKEAFEEFAKPLFRVGDWLLDHPDVIVSTLAGIGSVLLSYKVAEKIMDVKNSFQALAMTLTNPFSLAITAVGLAIGGAVGLATYIERCQEQLKEVNLAEHFGDISLSLEDLEAAAKYIVKNKSFEKIEKSLQSFDELERINRTIEETIAILDKANWKVSIGMELSDEDKSDYKDSVVSYIDSTQKAMLEKQYAMQLNLQVFTDNDAQGVKIKNSFDSFYKKNYDKVAALGTDLQTAVNKSFEDGLLTIDEVKEITELQNQIADITSKMAEGQFESKLEVLKLKFTGGELDAESFQNLQNEIGKQMEEATAKYDESLQYSIGSAKVMLNEGDITQSEYDETIKQFQENYLEQVGNMQLKATDFQLGTITEQYKEELAKAMPELEKVIEQTLKESDNYINSGEANMDLNWSIIFDDVKGFDKLDESTKRAISDLYAQMEPTIEAQNQMKEKYKKYGMELPESIKQGIQETSKIGALVGDNESIWNVVGNQIANSEEHKKAIETVEQNGWGIPEALANAIDENDNAAVEQAIDRVYNQSNNYIKETFEQGFDINTKLNFNMSTTGIGKVPSVKLPGHKLGGIFTTPHIAEFAEDGPEAAIALDGSDRSINIWKEVGNILGVTKKESVVGTALNNLEQENGGTDQTITYSPNINFYGDKPSKEDLQASNKIAQEEFEKMMGKYLKNAGRMRFA